VGGTGTIRTIWAASILVLVLLLIPASASATHGRSDELPRPLQQDVLADTFENDLAKQRIDAAIDTYATTGSQARFEVHRSPNGENWAVDVYVDDALVLELAMAGDRKHLLWSESHDPRLETLKKDADSDLGFDRPGSSMAHWWASLIAAAGLVLVLVANRPLGRLLALDIAALLGFTLVRLATGWSDEPKVNAAYLVPLLLIAARCWIGARGGSDTGRTLLRIPPALLLGLAATALAGRAIATTLVPFLTDVGVASVRGANAIVTGQPVYGNLDGAAGYLLDTYGPLIYLAHVPAAFVAAKSSVGGPWADEPWFIVSMTTIAADICVALILWFALKRFGVPIAATAIALWATDPEIWAAVMSGANDVVVAVAVVGAAALGAHHTARGAAMGGAAMLKFAPGVLLLPWLLGPERSLRPWPIVRTVLGCVAAIAISLTVVSSWGNSLHDFYEATIGFQVDRDVAEGVVDAGSAVALLGVGWLRWPLLAVLLGASCWCAWRGSASDVRWLAAGGIAVVAVQVSLAAWYPAYLAWLLPIVFAVIALRGQRKNLPHNAAGGAPHGTPPAD
jgi:hypothetical protein